MVAKSRKNLWSRVRRLFADDEPAAPAPARRAPQRPASDPPLQPAPQERQAFSPAEQARIDELLAQRPADSNLVGGKINLLNIDEIRQRLGAKWPRYEEQVQHIVSETLNRRLSEKDFFTRSGDDAYMILFHNTSEAEAKLKCALLGQEISRKFFGELEGAGCVLNVETLVATADGGVARERIHLVDAVAGALTSAAQSPESTARRQREGLTPEEVQELFGVAEERLQELEAEGKEPQEISLVRDRLRELIRQLKNIEGVLASPDQQWARMASADEPDAEAAFIWRGERVKPAEVVRSFIARADRTIERVGKPVLWIYDDEETQGAASEVRTSYLPMWSAAKRSVGLYLCRSLVRSDDREGAANTPIDADAELNLAAVVDRITLRRVKAELQAVADKGLNCLVVVPVHFSTLNRPGAAESYLPICHGISQDLRKMIVWEIRKAPLDSWSMHFQRIVASLQTLGRAVFVLAEVSDFSGPRLHRAFGKLAGINVQGVGLDIASYEGAAEEVISKLERFAAAAGKQALAAYVHGVHALSVNTAAVCAGFEHISGKVIAEPLDAPGGMREMPLDSLYTRTTADAAPAPERKLR